jgi:hypothetical protein
MLTVSSEEHSTSAISFNTLRMKAPVSISRFKHENPLQNCVACDKFFNWAGWAVAYYTHASSTVRLCVEHNPPGALRCVSHTFNLSDVVKSIFTLRWTRSEGFLLVWNITREGSLNKQWNAVPEAPNGCHNLGITIILVSTARHNSETFIFRKLTTSWNIRLFKTRY